MRAVIFVIFLLTISPRAFAQDTGTMVDPRDGREYKTVKIGDQIWMAENLAFTAFDEGAGIELILENAKWAELTTPAFCWYDNDEATYRSYGVLYNWYAVDSDLLCPPGWRLPNDEDFKELEMALGMDSNEADKEGIRGNGIGSKLKATGNEFWNLPNAGANNKSGFTALPEGHRNWQSGGFIDLGLYGTFWSTSEKDSTTAWRRTLYFDDSMIRRFTSHKRDGFSVRCIKIK